MEGDIAPLPEICELCRALRRAADGRRGARRRRPRARAAPGTAELLGVEDRVDLRMGTFTKSLASCGGFVAGPADVIDFLRVQSRAFLFTASARAGGRRRRAGRAADPALRRGPRAARARCSTTPRACATASRSSASRSSSRSGSVAHGQHDAPGVRDGAIVTPIVPVLVGDDWKAVLLWRALYDAGVFVNMALHPAVPPGGALLRTSVMATHDRATIDRALDAFADGQAHVRGRARTAPGARRAALSAARP